MGKKVIEIQKIGFQLKTESPFIACMYHTDHYPKGNGKLGPDASLSDRKLGDDFSGKDGFSMYYGETVPGFPAHPHRGFETVTIVLQGLLDHFDSKGAEGRYGNGDVQWLTTGNGCQHAEMFPLVNEHRDNPLQLFQIWLNLHKKNKMVEPDYKMLWHEEIPNIEIPEGGVKVKLIAGAYQGVESLSPTPASWAAIKNNHVGIMLIEMQPEAKITLPAISGTLNRNLYFYQGNGNIAVEGVGVSSSNRVKLSGGDEITILNGADASYLLLLEGEPINEPVSQRGPFVMNTPEEVQQAFQDFRETEFGGWPWPRLDPVHDKSAKRFARYPDGRIETRE